ncbi:MAG: hypothetical protein JST00_48125 [Deltaproteobacteria bacterium]|nr:hypothetical protein [Deltaproteobacteria bacterium]
MWQPRPFSTSHGLDAISPSRFVLLDRRVALLLVVGVVSAGRLARADDADVVEPIRIAYDAASPTCPDDKAFFREIAARTNRSRLAASSAEKARVLHVAIVGASSSSFIGRLLIEDGGSWSSAREVRGVTCGEVVEALGLIAALAIDPRASTAPHAAASAAATSASPSPSASSAPAPSTPAPSPSPSPSPAPSAPSSSALPPAAAPGSELALSAGLGAEASFLADLVGSGRVFADLEWRSPSRRVVRVDPSVRVAFARSLDVERTPAVGTATLRWTVGSAAGCPVRLSFGDVITLHPCAELTLGELDAEGGGAGVNGGASRGRPWASIAAQGRAVWHVLGDRLRLELEAGGMTPLFRESFFFEPGVPIYEAPVFVGFGRVGLGVRIF